MNEILYMLKNLQPLYPPACTALEGKGKGDWLTDSVFTLCIT